MDVKTSRSAELERQRRYQQESFSLLWCFISLVVQGVLTAALVVGLPMVVSAIDFEGSNGMVVSIPVWFVNISYNPPITSPFDINSITMWLGTIFWVIGFLFEIIGDFSLYAFKKNPENKGKIMDKSVWKYTQHPNYFGETLMWLSIFIIALAVPFGFITFIGPAYLTFQIIKVSGVVLLNKRFRGNDEYADYKKRTSSFIPWFPKKLK